MTDPKESRIRRPQYDAEQKTLLEQQLRTNRIPPKKIREELHVHKYEQERLRQEAVAAALDLYDHQKLEHSRAEFRQTLRDTMERNREFLQNWEAEGRAAWRENRLVSLEREAYDLKFEKKTMARRQKKAEDERTRRRNDALSGMENLELAVQRMGLDAGGGDGLDGEAPEVSEFSSGSELLAFLRSRLPTDAQQREEAALFLQRAREARQASDLARKERERRRRKVLVQQQKAQTEAEESAFQSRLLERVRRDARVERHHALDTLRLRQYAETIRRNREARQKKFEEQRRVDFESALQKDRILLLEAQEEVLKQTAIERKEYRKIEKERLAAKRAERADRCEEVLNLILDIADAAHHERINNDAEAVEPEVWRDWLALFVDSLSVSPPVGTDPSTALGGPPTGQGAEEGASAVALVEDEEEDPTPQEVKEERAANNEELMRYLNSEGQWAAVMEIKKERPPAEGEGENPPPPAAEGGEGEEALVPLEPLSLYASILEELFKESSTREDKPTAGLLKRPENLRPAGDPLSFRLSVIVRALIEKTFERLPPEPAGPLPDVPLKVLLTGKPLSGKKTAARHIADKFALDVIDPSELLKEALTAAGFGEQTEDRPNESEAPPSVVKQEKEKGGKKGGKDKTPEPAEPVAAEEEQKEESEDARVFREVGEEAQQFLLEGGEVPDRLYVRLIRQKILSLFPEGYTPKEPVPEVPEKGKGAPKGKKDKDKEEVDEDLLKPHGWILVGFPNNFEQYCLLEEALSGFVHPSRRPQQEPDKRIKRAAVLMPPPPEDPPPPEMVEGGADVHIRLEPPTEEVVRRAAGLRYDPQSGGLVHVQDDAAGIPDEPQAVERLQAVEDPQNPRADVVNRAHTFDRDQLFVAHMLQHLASEITGPRLRVVAPEEGAESPGGPELLEKAVTELLEGVMNSKNNKIKEEKERKLREEQEEKERQEREAAEAAEAAEREKEKEKEAEERAEGAEGDEEKPKEKENSPSPAPSGEEGAEGEEAQEEEAPIVVDLPFLAEQVGKAEEQATKHLTLCWSDLESAFLRGLSEVFSFERRLRKERAEGIRALQGRFLDFLAAPDERQSLVDAFVAENNRLFEEHPDLCVREEARAERVLRCDDLSDALWQIVDGRRGEALEERQGLIRSGWVEQQLELLASVIQRLVQVEVGRYRAALRLLEDFYFIAMRLGFHEDAPEPPTLDVLHPPVPRGEGAEGGAAEVEHDWKAEAAFIRNWSGSGPLPCDHAAEESGVPLQGSWVYPFIEELFEQARGLCLPVPDEFVDPAVAALEKKQDGGGGKDKDKKGGKKDDKGKKNDKDAKGQQEGEEGSGGPDPLFIDLQQARLEVCAQFLCSLAKVEAWGKKKLEGLSNRTDETFRKMDDWVAATVFAENEAIKELVVLLKEELEAGRRLPHHLHLRRAELLEDPHTLLYQETPPPIPPRLEAPLERLFSSSQLASLCEKLLRRADQGGMIRVEELERIFVTSAEASRSFNAALLPPSWVSPPGVSPQASLSSLRQMAGLFDCSAAAPQTDGGGLADAAEVFLSLTFHGLKWPDEMKLFEIRTALPEGPESFLDEKAFMALPLSSLLTAPSGLPLSSSSAPTSPSGNKEISLVASEKKPDFGGFSREEAVQRELFRAFARMQKGLPTLRGVVMRMIAQGLWLRKPEESSGEESGEKDKDGGDGEHVPEDPDEERRRMEEAAEREEARAQEISESLLSLGVQGSPETCDGSKVYARHLLSYLALGPDSLSGVVRLLSILSPNPSAPAASGPGKSVGADGSVNPKILAGQRFPADVLYSALLLLGARGGAEADGIPAAARAFPLWRFLSEIPPGALAETEGAAADAEVRETEGQQSKDGEEPLRPTQLPRVNAQNFLLSSFCLEMVAATGPKFARRPLHKCLQS